MEAARQKKVLEAFQGEDAKGRLEGKIPAIGKETERG